MFLGLDIFSRNNPVFLFLCSTLLILPKDNTKRTIAFNLSMIFFSEKKIDLFQIFFFHFFFRKSYPIKTKMVAS